MSPRIQRERILAEATAALERGASAYQIARRFAVKAFRAGVLKELVALLAASDSDSGLSALLDALADGDPSTPPRPKGAEERRNGEARSLRELMADPELTEPPPWDWYPYTAVGRLTLLSNPPKAGKSTLLRHYAVAKARGGTFLGQRLEAGPVLWVGPDEVLGDQVRKILDLGGDLDAIHFWVPPLPAPDVEAIAEEASRLGARLIVLDTLPRIARIADENDNAAWTAWSDRALPFVRSSGGIWTASHHHRKGGGQAGEAIRGASAIFGFVDIALGLHRVPDHKTRRRLSIEGTRYEDAEDLLIELRGTEYVALGDAHHIEAAEDTELARVRAALRPEPAKVSEIADRIEGEPIPEATLRRQLDRLVGLGLARREGQGGHHDPYRWNSSTPPHPRDVERWRSRAESSTMPSLSAMAVEEFSPCSATESGESPTPPKAHVGDSEGGPGLERDLPPPEEPPDPEDVATAWDLEPIP